MKNTEEFFVKLDNKIDRLEVSLSENNKTLAVYNTHLENHIKRTEIAELRLNKFEDEVKPALDAYKFVAFFCKAIIPVCAIIGIYLRFKN
jgi:hypothetical protein